MIKVMFKLKFLAQITFHWCKNNKNIIQLNNILKKIFKLIEIVCKEFGISAII